MTTWEPFGLGGPEEFDEAGHGDRRLLIEHRKGG
jgi:hypothetical protein